MAQNLFTDGRAVTASEITRISDSVAGQTYALSTAGGSVTTSSGMTVAIASTSAGDFFVGGTSCSAYAGGTATVTTADPTNPRRDIVVINTAGAVSIVAGTAAALTSTTGPVLPTPTSTQFVLAEIYVGAGVTTITSGNITDRRQVASPSQTFFNSWQTAFRVPRKLLGLFSAVEWSGADGTPTGMAQIVGVGFNHSNSSTTAAPGVLTNLLLEAYTAMASGAAQTDYIGSVRGMSSNVIVACTAPNKNPRMLIRWFPGASNASLTTTIAGFLAGGSAANSTTNGAYLRANTTGNLFFVTRQGGTETTTDLGARPTALTSYEIETTDSGVTWTCRNTTTATVVATHTTNVPTATTALGYVVGGTSGSGSLGTANVAYCLVESNTVA